MSAYDPKRTSAISGNVSVACWLFRTAAVYTALLRPNLKRKSGSVAPACPKEHIAGRDRSARPDSAI